MIYKVLLPSYHRWDVWIENFEKMICEKNISYKVKTHTDKAKGRLETVHKCLLLQELLRILGSASNLGGHPHSSSLNTDVCNTLIWIVQWQM